MPHSIPAATQAAFEEVNSDDAAYIFMTIEQAGHPTLRLVNDVVDYIRADGQRYLGCRFKLQWLTDSEDRARAQASVPNAVSDISEWVLSIENALSVTLEVLASGNFNSALDTVLDARTLNGAEVVLRTASFLNMRNIRANAIAVEGELSSIDLSAEPAFWVKNTKDRFPGAFR